MKVQRRLHLHTSAASFMAEPSAAMSVGTQRLRTRLATLVVDVIAVVRVANPLADVAASQTISALTHAAALRRLVEVPSRSRLNLPVSK